MNNNWISFFALFFVFFGFASLFGVWIFRTKEAGNLRLQSLPILIGLMILAISIWVVPYSIASKLIIAGASLSTLIVTALKLDHLPLHGDWAWLYIAITMGLIMLWSIIQGQAIIAFSMSIIAAYASMLALARGKRVFFN